MKSLKEILDLSTHYLSDKEVANARRQAEEVVSDALGIERLQLYLQFDRPLTQEEINRCRTNLGRRGNDREPPQYIRGSVEFFGCEIRVTPDVLIPRQETEILVDRIAKSIEEEDLSSKELWDLCTGSGCIGIALKKKFPQLKVSLSDISTKALAVAAENARNNDVEIELVEGDLLSPFSGRQTDLLVCNPPYISSTEYDSLDPEVRLHEPKLALVSGSTGLEFYERMAKELPAYLNPGGRVWFEIGNTQGEKLKKIFDGEILQDWAGHDRFMKCCFLS